MLKKLSIILFFLVMPIHAMDESENNNKMARLDFLDFGFFPIEVSFDIFYRIADLLSFFEIIHLGEVSKRCKWFWNEETRPLSFDEASLLLTHYAEIDDEKKFNYFWEKNEPLKRLRAVKFRYASNFITLQAKMEIYRPGCFVPLRRQEQILLDDFEEALEKKDIYSIKTMFIAARFYLFARNDKGRAHMALICRMKDLSLFEGFLGGLDRINQSDGEGNSVLHYVARYGTKEMVDFVCGHGANVNAINNAKETPLHLAAKFGRYQSVAILLEQQNINKEAKDILMKTPLSVATINGCFRSAQILIQNEANLESRDCIYRTSLHNACIKGRIKIVELLLKSGAKPNVQDLYGNTPMEMLMVVENKKEDTQLQLRNLLLNYGAKLAIVDKKEGAISTID